MPSKSIQTPSVLVKFENPYRASSLPISRAIVRLLRGGIVAGLGRAEIGQTPGYPMRPPNIFYCCFEAPVIFLRHKLLLL